MSQKKAKNGKKKKRKKKRPPDVRRRGGSGSGDLGAAAAAAAATPGQGAESPESWRVQQQAERNRLENVVQSDPDWISFSIGRARWLPFVVDKEIHAAFCDTRCWQADTNAISMWMTQAENSVIFYVLHRIIERPGRADLFRSLGRGWIFVMLDRPRLRFKWWFESVPLLTHNHPTEILALGLQGAQLEKYTRGYLVMSEIVFLLKGLTKLKPSDRNVPIISIQKVANDFKYLRKWATNDDVLNAVRTPFPTDKDRLAHTAKTLKREAAKIKRKTSNTNGDAGSADQQPDASGARCDRSQNFPSCAMYSSVFKTLGFSVGTQKVRAFTAAVRWICKDLAGLTFTTSNNLAAALRKLGNRAKLTGLAWMEKMDH
eukprot:INCI6285.1.p1 GENE.INCI6285.1~~INCI6285.1.p1  ORF type:complete len:373 (-),score=50.66 INCI6285.1:493-1611(-)